MMDTNFTNHFCDEVKGKISKCPARLDSHSGQRWAECRASSRAARLTVALGARIAGLSSNQYGVSKSKAGQLVGLVCSKRGNLVFLGTKFVTASGGCTCVGDPRVGGSRDQCGVSRSHEIMSTVAFLYRWEEKCARFCFLSCCPEVWWFTQSGIICVSTRGTSGPQRTESGGLARDLRWQFGLPDRRVWPEDLSLSCVSARRQMLWALGLNLTSTHLD